MMNLSIYDKNRNGFTLLEIVIVMVIAVVMIGIAVPNAVAYVNAKQLYNAATQLQEDIAIIQNKAVTYSSASNKFVLRFYIDDNAYAYVIKEGSYTLPHTLPSDTQWLVVREFGNNFGFPATFGNTTYESVRIGAYDKVTSGYVDLYFDNKGLAYWSNNGGSFQQRNGNIVLVNSNLTKVINVTVSPLGTVSVAWVKN